MMSSRRLFLALELPTPAKQQINRWREQSFTSIEKKPIPMANYHITLVFLGNTKTAAEQQLVTLLNSNPQGICQPGGLDLDLDNIGYWAKPRVMFLTPTKIPPSLPGLQQSLNQLVASIGLPTETRPYRPHVSLYRNISPTRFKRLQQNALPHPALSVTIRHFALYHSVSTADGVVYSVLQRFAV